MASKKKSFILYTDQQELFNTLPDEIAGKLIKHIFNYVNRGDVKTDNLLLDVAFSLIKQTLIRDSDKWKSQVKQRSDAGKKSAEKRANDKQRQATTVKTRSTNSTDSVNVSVSVTDSDKDIKHIHQLIVDEYIKVFSGILPIPKEITPARKIKINSCMNQIKTHDFKLLPTWTRYFEYVKKSSLLIGELSDWRANFDFLINKTNMLKVIEGNYDNK